MSARLKAIFITGFLGFSVIGYHIVSERAFKNGYVTGCAHTVRVLLGPTSAIMEEHTLESICEKERKRQQHE